MNTRHSAAYLGLLFVALIYSGNLLVGKSVAHLSPTFVSLVRTLIALALVSALFGAATVREWPRYRAALPQLALVALTGIASFNIFIYAALETATASEVAVAETMIPAVTALSAAFLLRERLRAVQWCGVALSFAGAVWVISEGAPATLVVSGYGGVAAMAGAVVSWVAYTLLVRRSLGALPTFAVLPPLLAIAALAQLPLALLWGDAADLAALGDRAVLAGLFYLGVFPSVVAFVLYNRAVLAVGASRAAIFLNLLPVFTIAGDAAFYGEAFTQAKLTGAAAVMIGVSLVVVRWRRGARRPAVELSEGR